MCCVFQSIASKDKEAVSIIALVLAALLMWKVIFPFLGWALGGIFGAMEFSFDGIVGAVKSFLN